MREPGRDARDWLVQALSSGERRLDKLQNEAWAAGFDWRAIEAAARRMGVRVYRSHGRSWNGTDPARTTWWVLL